MSVSRRRFLAGTAAATAIAAITPRVSVAAPKPAPPKPLRLLVLGGTGFLGPAIVGYAQGRGHTVTLFNRGKTRPDWFPTVDKRRGDRDPAKGDGLASLATGEWDAVIDDSGYFPRHVKASAELLGPRIGQYIFVSSISAYRDPHPVGGRETAPLATLVDPNVEEMGAQFENYGGLKAACERAAEAAVPGRTTIVRPGFIVGPDDPTGRFTYWPVRFTQPGPIAVPGAASDPVQVIDVRDLGEWLVRMAEAKTMGTFTACGNKLKWGRVIKACQAAASSREKVQWLPSSFVAKTEAAQFPIWAPPIGETRGFHTWSNARAVRAGLRFRPIETTVRDTLTWYKAEQVDEAQAREAAATGGSTVPPTAGDKPRTQLAFAADGERAVLEAWAKRPR